MYPSFEKAYLRPVSPIMLRYQRQFKNSVHRALLNELTPTQAIELIEMNLKNITQTKQVVAD